MRVGVVTTSYPRFCGDPAGNFVAEHVNWLCRAGHQVDVVCAGLRGSEPQLQPASSRVGERAGERAEHRPRIHRLRHYGNLFYHGGAPESLARLRAAPLWTAGRFSVAMLAALSRIAVHWQAAFAHWFIPSAAALALTLPRSVPMVAIAHSGDVYTLRRLGLTSAMAALLWSRRAHSVFVSQSLREVFCTRIHPGALANSIRRRSTVSPMGIDVARFRELRHRVSDGPYTVLFLGRLVAVKGVDYLLAAIARLPQDCPEVRVVVAGDGPLRAQLEYRAAGLQTPRRQIVFTGAVTTQERDRLLSQADVLVAPSVTVEGGRREGAPMVVREAMAAGVPVVASRVGGLGELPPNVVTFIPPADSNMLSDVLARCVGDRMWYARQTVAAARWVAQWDWARVGARLWNPIATKSSIAKIL